MDFTFEMCKMYNVMPFDILKQDKDEVIMFLNYMAEKSETAPKTDAVQHSDKQYIKVNDKTATGGWW